MGLYSLIRPFAFALDAERAHRLTIKAVKRLPPFSPNPSDPILATEVAGLHFPNPVGLAAGFDKDAEVWRQMLGFGFGFVEAGTLTPLSQAGNPRPRLFRLAGDRAIINRLGFNNQGLEAALPRLLQTGPGLVGANVGANKDSTNRIADYATSARRAAEAADFVTINISSPNTPGLRALQDRAALDELLAAVMATREPGGPPIFLKVAPDLEAADIDDIVAVAMERGVDALIVGNTTLSRPPLASPHRGEAGGLSGAPLKTLALQRLREFRSASGGAIPLIGVGGVESGLDAFDRIRAGASLVQLYTALVYQGPGIARSIARELATLLRRDGYRSVAEAVGT